MSSSPPIARSRSARAARLLARIVLGCVLALVAGEVLLRVLLFAPFARGLGATLRRPHVYADKQSDAYWKLQHLFLAPAERRPAPNPDARLGWSGGEARAALEPLARTADVASAPGAGESPQLVLLYGDSFAQGNTPREESFAAILAGSDLASSHELVNLGVGGYGLDQIWLSLAGTIDAFAARDPIVVVSLMVEDDLDRCALAFRGWPKPRLAIEGDELVLEAPVETDVERFLAAHPPGIPSYFAAALAHEFPRLGLRARTHRPERTQAELARLCARILAEIGRELRDRDLRHFVYLFHAESGLGGVPAGASWQEPLVREEAQALGMPLLSSRPYLLAAGAAVGGAGRFYGGGPGLEGHLNAAGNLVAFEGLRQGIREELEREDTARAARRFARTARGEVGRSASAPLSQAELARGARLFCDELALVGAREGLVRCSGERAPGGAGRWRLELARESARATRVRWPALPAGRTLRGRVRAVLGGGPDAEAATLSIVTSAGAAAARRVLRPQDAPEELEIPLAALEAESSEGPACALELELAAGPEGLVVVLEDLRFE